MDNNNLIKAKGGIRLDICCGANKQGPTWTGIDIQPLPGVDIVHDVNVHPWPLPDDCVLMAVASHVIEHIPACIIDGGKTRFPFIEFMDEVWRVMKPDGEFAMVYPHGNSQGFLQDPTHVHAINENVWYYFDPLSMNGALYGFYRPLPWKLKHISFDPSTNVEVVLIKRRMDKSYGR